MGIPGRVAAALTLLALAATAEPATPRAGPPARAGAELHRFAVTYLPPLPPAPRPNGPAEEARLALGKRLYLDDNLSVNRSIRCATCHPLNLGGADGKRVSPGPNGGMGRRNSPTVFHAALQVAQFWDGRAATVEEQAAGPFLNAVEMGFADAAAVEERLREAEDYADAFAAAFPGEQPALSFTNATRAIGFFVRSLHAPARYDRYAAGDPDALTAREKNGLSLFLNLGCIPCHAGEAAGGEMFQKFGIFARYWELTGSTKVDEGRFEVTGRAEDRHVFKVPALRNVAITAPYFHDGSVERLEDAVRIMGRAQLGVDLTPAEIGDITAFLHTLTGEPEE